MIHKIPFIGPFISMQIGECASCFEGGSSKKRRSKKRRSKRKRSRSKKRRY